MAEPGIYMTPGRFKNLGLGVSLSKVNDFELTEVLGDATATVDAYCNMPLLPEPGSFLGGIALNEEHRWRFASVFHQRGSRRVYPKHFPVVSVEALNIVVGTNAGATLPTDTLVINNAERWVEVTALTISTSGALFGTTGWVVPMGGLTEPKALLSYHYGWDLVVTGDRLRAIPGGTFVYQASHGCWTDDAPVVRVGPDVVSPADYAVDPDEGWITFVDDPGPGIVRADYHHRLPRDLARGTALVAADILGDSTLRRRGLVGGLTGLRINELEIRKQPSRGTQVMAPISPRAELLLSGFRHWSAS